MFDIREATVVDIVRGFNTESISRVLSATEERRIVQKVKNDPRVST